MRHCYIVHVLQECTCSLSDSDCYQWTLTINQMNYSKTDYGHCEGSDCSIQPKTPNDFPMERLNVTLAEIYIVTTNVDHPRLPCLQQTVECALKSVNPQILSNSL